ncbi:MAG: RNA methyltransferase [Chitinophagaceae bacterium]|jgi:TrmH family RNA methyltransferase|nr:MAG: RNA methyltransferase [Chitinophagaceae bacterium]
MLSKNELKYIQSLCQKKQRQEERLFLVEGAKLVEELLQTGLTVRKIYALPVWAAKHNHLPQLTVITEEELEKISNLQTPNQVLAIAEQSEPAGEPVLANQLTLVLDTIQDPGNLGTIIRIADWFGIHQIVASMDTVELYNPKVIQSTMGSYARVQVWYRPLADFLSDITLPVYGALLDGQNMYEVAPLNEGILLIGNESRGIQADLLPFVSHPITIPRIGGAESLNAAVAAGILVSHLTRPAL